MADGIIPNYAYADGLLDRFIAVDPQAMFLVRIYPGEMHAFHAFVWREQAQRCWQECFEFLSAQLAAH